jgi:hypothetical protein
MHSNEVNKTAKIAWQRINKKTSCFNIPNTQKNWRVK